MHEPLFAAAALPEQVAIMGLLMQPYAIGHELLLQKSANPLVTQTEYGFGELPADHQREKLFGACFICERTWQENQKPIRYARLTGFFRRHAHVPAEAAKFFAYRAAGSLDLPLVPQPRSAGAPFHYFGAPELARLILFVQPLHEKFGFATAFDFPLGLARMLYLTHAEEAGSVWVANRQDAERQAEREAYERAHPESTFCMGEDAVQASMEKWNREHPDAQVPLLRKPKPKKP